MSTNESVSVFARWLDPEKEPIEFDPAVKLLEWITLRWHGATITLRDIYHQGPGFLQNDRESALRLAEALVARGRLVSLKPRRRDAHEWHIIREKSDWNFCKATNLSSNK
jgi:hypothetical protein